MNEQTAFYSVILRRFFNRFQSITYHGVPIGKFVYRNLMSYWSLTRVKEYLPYFQEEMSRMTDSKVYSWFDEPYIYDPHPDGLILMRGGFGDIASSYLPKERSFLISPNQAEVDVIKLNRPDLTAHNIQNYYRENPKAVKSLNQQIAEVFNEQKDDPLLGSPELLDWFNRTTPAIVSMLDAVQSLFENLNVGAVLTISSTYSMDGALNLVARANHIPSLTVQHGIIAECNLFANIPILATKKAVWGDEIRNWYQRFGFPESRVAVVGSPRFDIIFNRKWCGKEKLCQMLQIAPSKKIIVYAAQIFYFTKTITPIILEGLKSIPDLFLVMMLHPGEAPSSHQQLVAGYPNCKVIQFGHISLYNALSGADLFITYYSTSAFEAMFFKLPVITVEPLPPPFSFGDLGASLKVTHTAGLNQIVNRLLHDETFRVYAINRYQKFLHEYSMPDGLASQRLMNELEILCRTGGIA